MVTLIVLARQCVSRKNNGKTKKNKNKTKTGYLLSFYRLNQSWPSFSSDGPRWKLRATLATSYMKAVRFALRTQGHLLVGGSVGFSGFPLPFQPEGWEVRHDGDALRCLEIEHRFFLIGLNFTNPLDPSGAALPQRLHFTIVPRGRAYPIESIHIIRTTHLNHLTHSIIPGIYELIDPKPASGYIWVGMCFVKYQ